MATTQEIAQVASLYGLGLEDEIAALVTHEKSAETWEQTVTRYRSLARKVRADHLAKEMRWPPHRSGGANG